VLLVHDQVAGPQRQRVDRVAPAPRRHPLHVLRGLSTLTGQVGLPEHGQAESRSDEAAGQPADADRDDAGLRRPVQRRHRPHRHLGAAELLDGPLRRAVPVEDHRDPPAVPGPPARVLDRAPGVPAVRLRARRGDRQRRVVQLRVGGERGDRPPRDAERRGVLADLLDRSQRRGTEVDGLPSAGSGDRALSTARGGRPRCGQELRRGPDQLAGPGPHPLRVVDQHVRSGRQLVQEQPELIHQHRRQRLHALDRRAVGDLVQHLGQLRVLQRELGRPLPDLRRQQQLAARWRPQAVLGGPGGALVGDGEEAHLLDLVAPELHPHRVLLGRREDVEDAAAHGELAALLDQLDPPVAGRDQPVDHVVELDGVPGPDRDRL